MSEYVEVADFHLQQVEIFAQNWFTALAKTPEQGAELKVQFMSKLKFPQNKQTAELAVTPILLSLTCWVFNDLKDLPAKRSDLYEQGLNLLLEKWDEKRGIRREFVSEIYRNLTIIEKQKLLSYIAIRKFDNQQYVLFERGEIERYIAEYLDISIEGSKAVLKSIEAQHGLVIERAQGIYSFSHLTFQEYFTAKWFCERTRWEGLVSHITDIHWREVFVLTVGMLPNADKLLQLMKGRIDTLLASEEKLKLQQFLAWLNQKSFAIKTSYKAAAVRAYYLALIHDLDLDLVRALDYTLELDLDLARFLALELDLDLVLFLKLDHAHARILALDLDLARALDLIRTYVRSFGIVRFLSLTHDLDHELLTKLHEIKVQLPTPEIEILKKCWKDDSQTWAERIRSVVEHLNIGQEWQFSEQDKNALKAYYNANKLLVHCLNSGCAVSDKVKEEIEETLLLPIAEIEKRQQRM